MLHSFVWSEPLYLTFMLAMIFCIRRYCETGASIKWLLLAAMATSLGLLTRYAGVSLILGGACVIVVAGAGTLRRRMGHLLLFGTASSALPTVWVGTNIILSGSATGRQISTMSPVAELPHLAGTMLNWWAPSYLPRWARLGIVALVAMAVLAIAVSLLRERFIRRRVVLASPMMLIVLILSATYVSFLFISRTWFDHRTPFDWRILSPLFATGLLFNTMLLQDLWQAPIGRGAIRAMVAPLCLAVLVGHVINTSMFAAAVARDGLGWNRTRFQDPVLIEAIQGVPTTAKLYSNDAAALEANMERPVLPVPVVARGGEREAARLRAFIRNAASGSAWVLYFPKKGITADGSLKAIATTAELRPVLRGSKWTLYRLEPVAEGGRASTQPTAVTRRHPRTKRKAAA